MRKITLLFSLLLMIVFMGAGCLSFSDTSGTETSGPAGMFVSINRGDTWNQIVALPTAEGVKSISGASIYRLVEDPNDNQAMYLASSNSGMFYSYDDGQSWIQAKGPMSSGFIYSVAVHPKDKCIIYTTTGDKIYRSDDCSRSWQEVYRESRSDTRVVSIAFSHSSPYKVYVAESNGDVLQSFDGSESWNVLERFGTTLIHIITHPKDNNLVYVVSRSDGLYRSVDAGGSWENLSSKMSDYSGSLEYRRHWLHQDDPNKMYWVSTYGVLVTSDGGSSWNKINLITPPGSASIYAFAVNPNNEKEIYYTATINSRSTFYKSQDGGVNWITKKLPSGQIPTILRVHPDHADWIYLGFTIPPKQ